MTFHVENNILMCVVPEVGMTWLVDETQTLGNKTVTLPSWTHQHKTDRVNP